MSQTKAQLIDGKSATIQFTGGSASAPAVSFTGDTNTGIYSPGADQVAISTNGTARLTITSDGDIRTTWGNDRFLGSYFSSSYYQGILFDGGNSKSLKIVNRSGDTSADIVFLNAINGAPTEKLRITSAGLVGIGTSTPAVPLDMKFTSSTLYSGTTSADNAFAIYNDSNTTGAFGSIKILTRNANDTAGSVNLVGLSTSTDYASDFAIQQRTTAGAFRENLRITHGGLVGIGTTTPGHRLQVNGAISSTGEFGTASANTCTIDATPGLGRVLTTGPDASTYSSLAFARIYSNGNGYSEMGRWDPSGRLLVGTSTVVGTNGQVGVSAGTNEGIAITNSTGATRYPLVFLQGTTFVGSVSTTGSATAYNTSSDYRLKENVVAVTDGITRLQQLNPCRFNFLVDPDTTVDGFIAHEVQTVVPEAITGEKDAVDDDGNPIYQGIDQSKLVPLLTAALQEAIGEIESLKARVAALESA